MTKIAVIVGSLAKGSKNRKLAEALEKLVPEDVTFVYPSIDLPLYNYEDQYSPAAQAFKDEIADADGVLIVTPEYNRSFPGGLKNALDWASRPIGENPFNGKPAAIIGASGGALGTTQAQQALRNVILFFNTILMGQPEVYLDYPRAFNEDGTAKESSVGFLQSYADKFVEHVRKYS